MHPAVFASAPASARLLANPPGPSPGSGSWPQDNYFPWEPSRRGGPALLPGAGVRCAVTWGGVVLPHPPAVSSAHRHHCPLGLGRVSMDEPRALLGSVGAGVAGRGQVCCSHLEGAAAETGSHWPAHHTPGCYASQALSDFPRSQPCPEAGSMLLTSTGQAPRTMPWGRRVL